MSEERPGPAVIGQRAEMPPGSIPGNRQTWIMLAVAVVIVLAVVFSGSAEHRDKTLPRPAAAVNVPDRAEIERYTQALRNEEQRLRQAQAEASRSREAFAQQVGTPAGPGGRMQGPYGTAGNGLNDGPPPGPGAPQRSVIEEDRAKREYAAAFASNIALTFRKEAEERLPKTPDAGKQASRPAEQDKAAPQDAGSNGPAVAPVEASAAHVLFEGTIIEAVLTNRLEGSFSGPVNCQVTSDVYSTDRQHLLIPRGSRVLGEARRLEGNDQQRLAVVFHRLIMPDGYSVNLDRVPGLDQAGATGLRDKVHHHYAAMFGTSVALGLLAGFSLYGTGSVITADGADAYRQGVAGQLGRDSTRILDRQLNRLPSVTIREGTRVKILLAGDIRLPDWHNHPPTAGV